MKYIDEDNTCEESGDEAEEVAGGGGERGGGDGEHLRGHIQRSEVEVSPRSEALDHIHGLLEYTVEINAGVDGSIESGRPGCDDESNQLFTTEIVLCHHAVFFASL